MNQRDDPETQCAQPLDSILHTDVQSRFGTHAPTQGDCSNADELAEREWCAGGERLAPDMYELETNDKGEKVVKETISDMAVNFQEQLCTH